MLMTYEAILQGNKLKWKGTAPMQVTSQKEIRVYVTLLDAIPDTPENEERGQKMVAALSALAALGNHSIPDPLAWQKEIRQDRPLSRE